MLESFGIKTKIQLSIFTPLLIMLLVGGLAFVNQLNAISVLDTFTDTLVPVTRHISRVEREFHVNYQTFLSIIDRRLRGESHPPSESATQHRSNLLNINELLLEIENIFNRLLKADPPPPDEEIVQKIILYIQKIRKDFLGYQANSERLLNDHTAAPTELHLHRDEIMAQQLTIEVQLDDLLVQVEQMAGSMADDTAAEVHHKLRMQGLLWALGVPIVILIGWRVAVGIITPLRDSIHMARELAAGDLEVTARPPHTHEMGELHNALTELASSLKRYSQQNAIQRRMERVASLSNMAIGIAHEITNPLANASIYLQLLQNASPGEVSTQELHDKLTVVTENVNKAVTITRELLSFARAPSHQFHPLNIHQPMEQALRLLEPALDAITIHRELTATCLVNGCTERLEQVFLNVFQNAVDAMPDGGTLTIATRHDEETLFITILDSGYGLPAKREQEAQEPFMTTKKQARKFGLGIPICLAILEQHHGELHLSNRQEGVGTQATITLPVWPSSQMEERSL